MSEEQLAALLAKIKEEAGLQEKLKGAADLDAFLAIAKEAGFVISAEELKRAQSEILEEEKLEGVAGGWGCSRCTDSPPPSTTQFIHSRTCTN